MRWRNVGPVAGLVLGACFGLAGPARAESGVVVDPNSPAGVEYAIPLDHARDQYGGAEPPGSVRASVDGGAAKVQALFGRGLRRSAPARTGGSRRPDRAPETPAARQGLELPAASKPVSATATSVGIFLGILLLGLGFGALMRLRRRPDA